MHDLTFYTDGAKYIVCVGSFADGGMLSYDQSSPDFEWRQHTPGTISYDNWHQEIFRNHRWFDRVEWERIQNLVPALPVLPLQMQSIAWQDNFDFQPVPAQQFPGVAALLAKGFWRWRSVFVVFKEDLYETLHGDGKFLYLEAVFSTNQLARDFIQKLAAVDGYRYSIRRFRIMLQHGQIIAHRKSRPQLFEHCDLRSILTGLEKSVQTDVT